MTSTEPARILASHNVVCESEAGMAFTADFQSALDANIESIENASQTHREREIRELFDAANHQAALGELAVVDPRALSELVTLVEYIPRYSALELLPLLPVLWLFRQQTGSSEGAPASFIPIQARQLPGVSQLYTPCVVYVWLEDCDPCDRLKMHLESIFPYKSGCYGFAIYGPGSRESLAANYDVTAGPALLFMRDGTVECRLYGTQDKRSIELELETLLNIA